MVAPANILIVDDDPVVHESLSLYFEREGFVTCSAFNGREGLEKFRSVHPALIVLDMMMPEMNGSDVCREIRKTSNVPIIMLTAKSEEIDKIVGLELGADDYITKPFSVREVVARVKAVLRRMNERNEESPSYLHFKGLEINPDHYQVRILGETVPFTPKEFDILYLLASNPGQVIEREQIIQRIWGYEQSAETRTIDTHIKKIRQKLSVEGASWALITVYGIGYKLEIANS